MATFRKRGDRWQAIVRKKGRVEYETFATKSAAQAWATKVEREIEEGLYKSVKGRGKTVDDALKEYGVRVSVHKPSNRWEQRRLKWFSETSLAKLALDEVDRSHIARFRDERLKDVSGSTVNRDLNLLSHVFSTCVTEWLWMDENPCKGVRRPKESPPRERRVSEGEIATMRAVLGYEADSVPQNTRQLVANLWLTSLETAMRLGEVASIDADTFDTEKRTVRLDKTKNGDRRIVPVNSRAAELINLRLQCPLVGNPHNLSKSFENAVGRSGITDMTYHDSRHEGITRLAQKLHILDLMKVVGIRNINQLRTYYDATPEEIVKKLD